jgi:hypothetical protein
MAIRAAELYVKVGAETAEAEKGLLGVATQLSSVATQAGQVGGAVSSGVVAALGALPGPVGVATVGLTGLTGTWSGLTGAMVASGGVMRGVAVLLGATMPVVMGTTTVAMGLLTAAWSGGWGSMGMTTGETWENGIRPTLDALGNYLSVTIPGALSTMRVAWERDWAAAAGAIEAVSAAFDGLVARLSRPLPNPAAGISAPEASGTGTPPPASSGGGRGGVAMASSRTGFQVGGAIHAAPRGASEFAMGNGSGNTEQRTQGTEQWESGEVVSLLRALLLAVQRQERSVTIELDGRAVGRAMSRQRASSLLYDTRS